jgi:hypothetical protein
MTRRKPQPFEEEWASRRSSRDVRGGLSNKVRGLTSATRDRRAGRDPGDVPVAKDHVGEDTRVAEHVPRGHERLREGAFVINVIRLRGGEPRSGGWPQSDDRVAEVTDAKDEDVSSRRPRARATATISVMLAEEVSSSARHSQ